MNEPGRVSSSKLIGAVRIGTGAAILISGILKIVYPVLREAWSQQLLQSKLPFYGLHYWSVPVIEVAVGAALAAGFYSRISALAICATMTLGVYIHLNVSDPTIFPLQTTLPVFPVVIMAGTLLVGSRGGGAWSVDLRRE